MLLRGSVLWRHQRAHMRVCAFVSRGLESAESRTCNVREAFAEARNLTFVQVPALAPVNLGEHWYHERMQEGDPAAGRTFVTTSQ